MYGFGDDRNPGNDTVNVMEEILIEFITDVVWHTRRVLQTKYSMVFHSATPQLVLARKSAYLWKIFVEPFHDQRTRRNSRGWKSFSSCKRISNALGPRYRICPHKCTSASISIGPLPPTTRKAPDNCQVPFRAQSFQIHKISCIPCPHTKSVLFMASSQPIVTQRFREASYSQCSVYVRGWELQLSLSNVDNGPDAIISSFIYACRLDREQ